MLVYWTINNVKQTTVSASKKQVGKLLSQMKNIKVMGSCEFDQDRLSWKVLTGTQLSCRVSALCAF